MLAVYLEKSHKPKIRKNPEECENMVDIRAEIDFLDRQVIALLGKGFFPFWLLTPNYYQFSVRRNSKKHHLEK